VIRPGNVFPTPGPAGKATLPAGRWDLTVPDAAAEAEEAEEAAAVDEENCASGCLNLRLKSKMFAAGMNLFQRNNPFFQIG